jgi:hypothetical protein
MGDEDDITNEPETIQEDMDDEGSSDDRCEEVGHVHGHKCKKHAPQGANPHIHPPKIPIKNFSNIISKNLGPSKKMKKRIERLSRHKKKISLNMVIQNDSVASISLINNSDMNLSTTSGGRHVREKSLPLYRGRILGSKRGDYVNMKKPDKDEDASLFEKHVSDLKDYNNYPNSTQPFDVTEMHIEGSNVKKEVMV